MAADPGPLVGRIGTLARRVGDLQGWRRWLTAAGLGVSAVAAQAPLHVLPGLVVAFAGLVWLLDGAGSRRRAFLDGWLFGVGYFAAGLYWVANAFLVEAARFAWMIPAVVLGLSCALALFIGMATLVAHRFWPSGIMRICLLAAAWAMFEWLRGWVLTGFPWNSVGTVWVAAPPVLQAAAWIGVYGLSMVTVYAAAAFGALAAPGRLRWPAAVSGVLLLAAFGAAGAVRLAAAPDGTVPEVRLRIVQPNVDQRDKIRSDRRQAGLRRLALMSMENAGGGATHVIWPEAAVRLSMLADPRNRPLVRAVVPRSGLLVTGAVRVRRDPGGRATAAWNSVIAVDHDGGLAGIYDKHHLVPLGEYVPLRGILPLAKLTPGRIDFSAGPGPRTLDLQGLPPFSPLICYEVIFPGAVVASGERPRWLLNVTNDAWFGYSSGPYQHFAAARMRAVEEGLPLVRAANTGISAVVDAYGRVAHRLSLGERGVIDAPLPGPAAGQTLYARFGDIPAAAAAILIFGGGLVMYRRRAGNGAAGRLRPADDEAGSS